ncbi:hypothetical protein OS493_018196 [Desmophyllum pertusum]|uniref:Uncharacterized protein n=1 Tax=Desmophyllum pertusum TaxID=174260 RepID=A0A9X0CJY4_9CNID|nr:hypothetical protein OS493_018196 [Desmophyllum pertusum]
MAQYQERVPEPLNRQFPERLPRDEAIKRQAERKRTRTELFPSAEDQESLQQDQTHESAGPPPKKKARNCSKCGRPMRPSSRSLPSQ